MPTVESLREVSGLSLSSVVFPTVGSRFCCQAAGARPRAAVSRSRCRLLHL